MPINGGRALKLDGKVFNDLKEYERKTYVSADEIGRQFGYEVKDSQSGLVLDLWTKSGGQASTSAPANYPLRVLKKEKTTSPNPEYDMYKLTLEVRNPASVPARIHAKNFRLVDDKGTNQMRDIGLLNLEVQFERSSFWILSATRARPEATREGH